MKNWATLLLVLVLIITGKTWAFSSVTPPASALREMGQAVLEKKSVAQRRALEEFARAHGDDLNGVLGHLVLGYAAYQQKQYMQARSHFQAARLSNTPLQDYAEFYLARSDAAEKKHAGVAEVLDGFAKRYPSSPLAASAVLLHAESLIELDRTAEAEVLLLSFLSALPRPEANRLLAETYRKESQFAKAAERLHEIYYLFPTSTQAAEAEKLLKELRVKLGAAFPAISPALRATRADRLFAASRWRDAQTEYQALAAATAGRERSGWKVRVGVCQYRAGATWPALETLRDLKDLAPEADAERIYTLAALYRRLDRAQTMEEQIDALEKKYPQSPWYERALFLGGNYYRIAKNTEREMRFYRMVYERFPRGENAATSHWYVAWQSYRERRFSDAKALFAAHVRNYPASPQVAAALYWLGRLVEAESPSEARNYYQRLVGAYPNYYYGLLAREQLEALSRNSQRLTPVSQVVLQEVKLPVRSPRLLGTPTPEEQQRLERAQWLAAAWLMDFAVEELSALLQDGSPSLWLIEELARLEQERGRYHVAMRFGKRYVNGYLALDVDDLSRDLWIALYPLPWWELVQHNAKAAGLDPYLVAGLIRQESEFNPEARSRSNARGLMQLLPTTAREVARKVSDPQARSYSLAKLYRPEINLVYGTHYLRGVLDRFNESMEHALAGYNAGPNRVAQWTRDADFLDAAEFVESIPITETREYVQAVLRNAAFYRRLYTDAN